MVEGRFEASSRADLKDYLRAILWQVKGRFEACSRTDLKDNVED